MMVLRPRVVLLTLVLMVVAGCNGAANEPVREAPGPPTTEAPDAEAPASPAVELPALLAATDRAPGVDTLAVIDRLPEPQRVEEDVRENRHLRDAVDTVRTYHYEELAFTVVHAANGKELLQEVHVTGEDYVTDNGLQVGLLRAEVEHILGQPARTEEGAVVYEVGEPTPDVVRVRYENDRVDAMTWSFYVD